MQNNQRPRKLHRQEEITVRNLENNNIVQGVAFSEVVKGNGGNKIWQRKKNNSDEWCGLKFEVKEEDMACLDKCYVGYVHNPNAVYLLQDRIIDQGVFTFTITPMGGDMVLIKPTEGEDFDKFLKEYEDLITTWFYDVRGWSRITVPKERDTWVRCQGVPLHAWSSEFF